MDRYKFLSKNLPKYLCNDLINEIIISDENGNDANQIEKDFINSDKIKVFRNKSILGPFLNKITVCKYASNEWIALIDSDNFAKKKYFLQAKRYIEDIITEKNIILSPCSSTSYDFSHLSGKIITKYDHAEGLLNNGNYILNKYLIDNFDLKYAVNDKINLQSSFPSDTAYMNMLLFKHLDMKMHVVPDMIYEHVIHKGSIWIQKSDEYKDVNHLIFNLYKEMVNRNNHEKI